MGLWLGIKQFWSGDEVGTRTSTAADTIRRWKIHVSKLVAGLVVPPQAFRYYILIDTFSLVVNIFLKFNPSQRR